MIRALETKVSKGDELSDFVLPYNEMPNDYLASDFFEYKTLEERKSVDYFFLLENINLRSHGEPKNWIYQNLQGYGKHCLDLYLFSKEKNISPSSTSLNSKVGAIKKAYGPEIVSFSVKLKGKSKSLKVNIGYVKENQPKRIHATHGEMYRKGEKLFELVNYLTE